MDSYKKLFLGTIIFFILFYLVTSILVNNHVESEEKALEKQRIESAQNQIDNAKITVSSSIKSNGEYTFIMFTNLPDEAQIEGDILHIKNNSADEVIDTFKGVIKNERFVLEGTIDPTIFKKDNVAKLKFVGNIKVQDLSKTFETEIYDYTKYFLPPEPVEQIEEENELNKKYEEIQKAPVKTFNIPSAYMISRELVSTYGFNYETSTTSDEKITGMFGDDISILLTGDEISRVFISGVFPTRSIHFASVLNIIFSDMDLNIWVKEQIDNSKNGRNPHKNSYIKDDLNVQFESNRTGFSITATPR